MIQHTLCMRACSGERTRVPFCLDEPAEFGFEHDLKRVISSLDCELQTSEPGALSSMEGHTVKISRSGLSDMLLCRCVIVFDGI